MIKKKMFNKFKKINNVAVKLCELFNNIFY